MDPFATLQDLEARWRPLTDGEKPRAQTLLSDAGVKLSLSCQQSGVLVNSDDELQAEALKAINCEMVKRAMMSPIDMPPVSNFSQTAGSYSESQTYVNPTGDLYLTLSEKKLLGIGGQRLGSIAPVIGGE